MPSWSRRGSVRLPRGRVVATRALVVLATVLLLVSMLALWVDRLVLDTDTWTDTSEELLEDDEVRAALAAYLTDQLFSSVDVAAELEQALPPRSEGLAGPVAAGLRQLTERAANRLLARPRVVQAWRVANRDTHARLLAVIDDRSEAVETEGGRVVLHVRPLLEELNQQTGLGGRLAERLPEDAGGIVILEESDQLESVQTLMRILELAAAWLWAIALALFALALYLARGRRRETLRGAAFGFVLAGLVVLAILRITGNRVVESLVESPLYEDAAQGAFAIVAAPLRTSAWAVFTIGLIVVLGTWLAGPGVRATSARRRMAPTFRDRPEVVWGGFFFVFLLLLVWGPIQATRNLVGIVVLGALAALGLEMFRRLTAREFPASPRD